jgi:HK97 family phage major capsid protein
MIDSHINRRDEARTALAALQDAAAGRPFTATERAESDALAATIEDAQRSIDNAAKGAAYRGSFAGSPAASAGVNARADFAAFAAEARDNGAASMSLEYRDDVALLKGVATDGAEIVPTRLSETLVSYLEAGSPVIPAVNSIATEDGADLIVPVMVSRSTPAFVAEGATIGRSGPQFGTVTIGAKKVGLIVQASRELLQDSSVDIVTNLVEQAAFSIGRSIESEIINGTNFTDGLLDATTVTETLGSATAVSADELFDIAHSVSVEYRSGASWVMSDATYKAVRLLADSTGQYLLQPGLTAGAPATLLGAPVIVAADMPNMASSASSIVFGDLRRAYTYRTVGAFDVTYSDAYAYSEDLGSWRFVARADGALVDENAIVVVSNAA